MKKLCLMLLALCLLLTLAPQALASSIEVPATAINVSPSSMMLTVNGSDDLSVTVEPFNTTQTGVMFSSSDSTVASVTNTGHVTAHKPGTCQIFVQSVNDHVAQKFCSITVLEPTKLSLDTTRLSLQTGFTAMVNASVTPYDIAIKGVTFSSSNSSVAAVSNEGGTYTIVTGVSAGTATIYASAADGTSASCVVTVGAPITAIKLNQSSVTLNGGSVLQLTATVEPSNATDKSVTWSSSDERVATVDQNGTVTTWNTGYAMITATANDGSGVKGSCNFAVVGLSVTHAPTATPSPSPAPTLAPGQTPVPPSGAIAANLASGSLNLRASASQNSKILARIPQNAHLVVVESGSRWCRVWYNGTYGYVMTQFLSPHKMPTLQPGVTPSPTPVVTMAPGSPSGQLAYVNTVTGSLNMRAQANGGAKVVRRIPEKAAFTVITYGANWCYAWYNGTSGYVMTKFVRLANATAAPSGTPRPATAVTPSPEPLNGSKARVNTTGGSLNMRSAATTSSSRVRLIPNKTVIDIVTYGKEWCYARYDGSSGYVMTKFLVLGSGVNKSGSGSTAATPAPTVPVSSGSLKYAQVVTGSGGLNLRKGPGTGYGRITIIPKNGYVTVLNEGLIWTQVNYNGITGYVMTVYLKKL